MTYKIRWKDHLGKCHDDRLSESQLYAAHCSFTGVCTEGGHMISSHQIEFDDPKYDRASVMARLVADIRRLD